ncbi:MAG: hypothetical protein D6808_04755 [Candidatus Dadabacteria bacterium]|nr:MAG: hypothetical protein D6808_04755 [Candidatus Dadabacteria bacterium]
MKKQCASTQSETEVVENEELILDKLSPSDSKRFIVVQCPIADYQGSSPARFRIKETGIEG